MSIRHPSGLLLRRSVVAEIAVLCRPVGSAAPTAHVGEGPGAGGVVAGFVCLPIEAVLPGPLGLTPDERTGRSGRRVLAGGAGWFSVDTPPK